jgi:hypothetical protein
VVEHDLAKVGVEGSNPFARSRKFELAELRQAAVRRLCRLPPPRQLFRQIVTCLLAVMAKPVPPDADMQRL